MINEIPLTRNDVIQIIEHGLSDLSNVDLTAIVNQFTLSWIRVNPDNYPSDFTWTGGERPNYLSSVTDMNILQKIREEIRKERVDNQ